MALKNDPGAWPLRIGSGGPLNDESSSPDVEQVVSPGTREVSVWYCEVHRSIGTETMCDGQEIVRFFHEPESPCRIVAAQLFLNTDKAVV